MNNATKDLPPTQGPSRFVLTAHQVLPPIFPTEVCITRNMTILQIQNNLKLLSNIFFLNFHSQQKMIHILVGEEAITLMT